MSEEEQDALTRLREAQEELVKEALSLKANGSWPASELELDIIGAGGGFKAAANMAGAALLYAFQDAGVIAGVRRARGSSAGAYAGLTQSSNTWTPEGLMGWLLRQPRYFKTTVGSSAWWRFVIPYETWYWPSTMLFLAPGDYRRISGRVWIPHTRGCWADGLRETETGNFDSNEAVADALSKSMFLPLVFGRWNTFFGLRDGEIVLDAGFSRNFPLFVDGPRPQVVLTPRPEVDALTVAPLPDMLVALLTSQRDVFELLRRWDGRPNGAQHMGWISAEIVPAGRTIAQCANARLNNWELLNSFRRKWLSTPKSSEPGMDDAWQLLMEYDLNSSRRVGCAPYAPSNFTFTLGTDAV